MERTKLREARLRKGYTQEELAAITGFSVQSISDWEQGKATPHTRNIKVLCELFGCKPEELGFAPTTSPPKDDMPPPPNPTLLLPQEDTIMDYLKSLPRRELLAMLQALPALATLDLTLLDTPNIAPEEFLSATHAALSGCWQLLSSDRQAVDRICNTCLITLSRLATQPSEHQSMAASLAVQAKILQGLIAMHQLDTTGLEIHCRGAVRFGRLSGDRRLLATTLSYQGSVHAFHLPSTKKAIPLYQEGLANLDSAPSLNKADLSIGMAHTYAQNGDEANAIEMVSQAKKAMPEYPELDAHYHLIDFGLADLDRVEGRVYLELAERMKSSDYAEKAYTAFSQGTSKQATSSRSESQTLIHRADAVLHLGDLRTWADCLETGYQIGRRIGSRRREQEARTVLNKAPQAWRKERRYQEVAQLFDG